MQPAGPEDRPASISSGSQHSSAIQALANTRAMRMRNLPSFMRYKEQSARTVFDLATPTSGGIRQSVPTLGSLGSKSLPRPGAGILRNTTGSSKRDAVLDKASIKDEAERLLHSLSDPQSDPNEALFTTNKDRFTRVDLSQLVSEDAVPRKILQAYLSHLQKVHKRRYARGKSTHRLKLFKLDLSYDIFNRSRAQSVHCAENIFTLDYLLFPVFVGYWSLLVLNVRERTVTYFDPMKKYLYVETLLVCLLQYLGSELLLHESRALEMSDWKDILYKGATETHSFAKAHSSLYVLKHAEDYVKGWPQGVHPADLQQYRERVFFKLVTDWSAHSP